MEKKASRIAQRLMVLRTQSGKGNWLANPYVMHVSRLCLMLADHHYSSLVTDDDPGRVKVPQGYPLYANTKDMQGELNQTLDEHLIGVAQHSAEVTHYLPKFDTQLPRLARHKGLKKRSKDERFRWQDKAADSASAMRERSLQSGAFIVNMASTGCGKTLANARIMYSLANADQGMRCSFALGLRTLTLQTGQAFRDLLSLGDDDLAIRVGGSASRALFNHYEQLAEVTGSASRQDLLDEDSYVRFEGNHDDHPLLRRVMYNPQVRSLLAAPLLVCTIDHLIPATDSERGGRQIAPMLRLMSGDLVLDEPDDFDIKDLPALTRLVHWAGLLGSRVLLSSATLPPALVQGLFEAYINGRKHFKNNRGERHLTDNDILKVCCAWFDEFNQFQMDCSGEESFVRAHQSFVTKRYDKLITAPVRRRGKLLPVDLGGLARDQLSNRFAELVIDAAVPLHAQHHSAESVSGKRVSFGLVRMANIEPLVEVALAMYRLGAPEGTRIHLCTYHSQFPLLLRSAIERQLDEALNRRWPDREQPEPVFQLSDIRHRLDKYEEKDHLFVVLGSPVTEVGRDHDYDWAVVEPSSMRSLIQLAGRVRRHREGECKTPNILIFDTNLRHFRELGKPAFCKPGFESVDFPLETHSMERLLFGTEFDAIDARPRIISKPSEQLQPRYRLVDLEHTRMRQTMLVPSRTKLSNLAGRRQRATDTSDSALTLNAASWWHISSQDALLTGLIQQQSPFRFDPVERVDLQLQPNEEGDAYELVQFMKEHGIRCGEKSIQIVDKSKNHRIPDAAVTGNGITPWGNADYLEALTKLAGELDLSLVDCARRFSTVTLPENDNGWRFHSVLGFSKSR